MEDKGCPIWCKPKWMAVYLLFIGLLVLIPGAGKNRPLEFHEAYVPLVAAEMLRAGNFVVPYYNGKIRLQKPPLAYWLVAGVYALKGTTKNNAITEIELRLPSIISGLLLLFVTAGLGYLVFGDTRVGWVAAVFLATSKGFIKYGMNVKPEMIYMFFSTLQLFGFIYLQRASKNGHHLLVGGILLWVGFAGAVLAKGPLFPIFFIVSTGLGLLVSRSRPPWRVSVQLVLGILTVMILAAYFLYLSHLVKGAGGVWKEQMLQSSSTPFWMLPFQNKFYFVKAATKLLRPWVVFLPLALFALWRYRKPETWILGFAVLVPIFFLSFSGKMRGHYVLPIIPILFVLISRGCVYLWDLRLGNPTWRTRIFVGLGGYALFFTVSTIIIGVKAFQIDLVKNIDPVYQVCPFLLAALLALIWTWRNIVRQSNHAFAGLILAAAFLYAGIGAGGLDWKPTYYTNAEFGKGIAAYATENQLVVCESRYNLPAIIFYSGHLMPKFGFSKLDKLMQDHPDALIVTEAKRIKKVGVKGEIVLQERESKKNKRRQVLFRPASGDY